MRLSVGSNIPTARDILVAAIKCKSVEETRTLISRALTLMRRASPAFRHPRELPALTKAECAKARRLRAPEAGR